MYQIKIGEQTLDLSVVNVDRDSCTIQLPGKYSANEIKAAFSDGLAFTVVADITTLDKDGQTVTQTAEYLYTGYIRAGEPETVTIGGEQRVQIVLYKTDEPNSDDLAAKVSALEAGVNRLSAAIKQGHAT